MNLWAVCIVLHSGDLTASAVFLLLLFFYPILAVFHIFCLLFWVLFAWISFLFFPYCLKCSVHSQWYICYPPQRTSEICHWAATVLIFCNNMCFICFLMTCISHSLHDLWFFFPLFSILPHCVCVCVCSRGFGAWLVPYQSLNVLPSLKAAIATHPWHSSFFLHVVPLNIIFIQLSWNC